MRPIQNLVAATLLIGAAALSPQNASAQIGPGSTGTGPIGPGPILPLRTHEVEIVRNATGPFGSLGLPPYELSVYAPDRPFTNDAGVAVVFASIGLVPSYKIPGVQGDVHLNPAVLLQVGAVSLAEGNTVKMSLPSPPPAPVGSTNYSQAVYLQPVVFYSGGRILALPPAAFGRSRLNDTRVTWDSAMWNQQLRGYLKGPVSTTARVAIFGAPGEGGGFRTYTLPSTPIIDPTNISGSLAFPRSSVTIQETLGLFPARLQIVP